MKLIIDGKNMTDLVIKNDALLQMSWCDLLNWIEVEHLKAGQCIARVTIDGKEETNYRDFMVGRQLLKHVDEITITIGHFDFDSVVRKTLTELDQELGAAIRSIAEIVRDFENRHNELAYGKLEVFVDGIKIFDKIFSDDLGWSDSLGTLSRSELAAGLERALTQLTAAKESGFWVSMCDILEYEIAPILEAWRKIVERTGANLAQTKPASGPAPESAT